MQEPRTRIRLCGPLAIEIDGRDVGRSVPAGQARLLLTYLLARPGHAAERRELIDVLWPQRPPQDPQAALRPLLSRLRRALAPATLDGSGRLQLELPEPVWIDVDAASGALEGARAAARQGDWATASEQAQAALELLEPGLLPGQEDDWLDARRAELEELELEALEWVARGALARGDAELAQRSSRELIARAPYRETGYRFAMQALAAAGNVAEALRVYDDLRVLLRDELGTAPAAELQALHGRLLAGDAPAPAPAAARRAALPRRLAPDEHSAFVGRRSELDVLCAAWARARGGRRQLVLVAGEPGIGKTRLTSELARELHGAATVLYGACQEEALVSYEPFVEALRAAGLEWASLALGPGAGELARLIPELGGHDPAPPGDPETRRYLMFESVSLLLAQASAQVPLLLVLDDLHWADRATLHLLRHVVRSPHEAALLIVGTYRDGEVGPEHPLVRLLADLRRDRLFERVALSGLDAGGVGALIAAHAGHAAPPGVVGAVHERTEGNPFFVEEVMRHLIETGVLVERGGRWASALTADEIGVPEGVKEVLARRLAGLSDACRGALAQAAVLGRTFSFEVLAAMAGGDEDELIAAVEEAVVAQLAVEAGGPAYAFTHALVRETLYGGLSVPRRQRLHARAARAIEAVFGEAQLAALAVHERLAGAAGDAGKAIDRSLRAGAQAFELLAWEEAAAHWDGALAAMARRGGQETVRAGVLVNLADLMVVVGDLGRQIGYLERALALYDGLGDRERAAQVHSRLGMACSLIDSIYAEHLDIGRAFEHFDAARAVLAEGRPRRARGHLETGVATALTYAQRIDEGIEAGARAMEIGEQLGDDLLWAGAAQAYGWHRIVAGDLREGFGAVARAFDAADRHQRPFLAFMGSNIRGQLTWGLGAPDEARAAFEHALALPYAGRSGYRQELADGVGRCHAAKAEMDAARALLSDAKPAWITHSLKPLVDLWDGNWDAVRALADATLATSRRTANRWDEWASYHLAARVHALRGEPAPAAELLERALAIVAPGGARYFELWVRPDLARALAALGRIAQAREHVERCLQIVAGGEDWRGRAGHVALAEAVVLAGEDRPDEAAARFACAHATFERYGLVPDRADALHTWGHALAEPARLERARELYRRHGAGAAWLAR